MLLLLQPKDDLPNDIDQTTSAQSLVLPLGVPELFNYRVEKRVLLPVVFQHNISTPARCSVAYSSEC